MRASSRDWKKRLAITKLWRLPATLSFFALVVIPLVPQLARLDRGSLLREGVVFLVALGMCSMILGFGLGIWIAIRTRRSSAFATAAFSALVALMWWHIVVRPLIQGTGL